MAKMRIEGSFVATVTAFNENGSVDHSAMNFLIDRLIRHNASAVLILGSTGEPSLLSPEEKRQVIVETAKRKNSRARYFYGCTGNTTQQVIDNVKFVKENGGDGAVIAAPPYICGSEADIEAMYQEVADAVEFPLGIYNNAPRIKTDLHWENLLRLFKHPNIVIHKESTARVGQVAQVLAAKPDVTVMCCDSPNLGLVVPTMALGGHGTANMGGNIAPEEMAVISTPWLTYEDARRFKETYLRLLPLLHFNYSAVNPVAVKSLMKALGLPTGSLRKPLRELEAQALLNGIRIVRELELDRKYGYKIARELAKAA